MLTVLLCLLDWAGAISLGGLVQAAPAKGGDPFQIGVVRSELPSGLTVLLHQDRTLPQVVVSLRFNVGSRDERPGRTGFAHLYEHLMFMGTKNVPGGAFDQIMEAEGGFNNATTNSDRTFYYDVGPSHLLPTLLWLEAERLTTLPEAMTDEKVALQREVVRNERRQSYENRPYGRAELLIPEAMYAPGHPYSWPVIGSHADLIAASTADVRDFFYRYYVPSNAVLMVAGDFDLAEAQRLVQHYFGWMPKRPRPSPPAAGPAPRGPQRARLAIEDQVELARVYLVWHAPGAADERFVDTQVLADLLGRGKASRLHKALVVERQLAQSVDVGVEAQQQGSLLVAEITAKREVRPEALVRAAEEELARAVTGAELARAQSQRLTDWAREIETLLGRSAMAVEGQALRGDPQLLKARVARLRGLSAADLQALAAELRLRDAQGRLTLTVTPRGKGAAPAPVAEAPRPAVKAAPLPPPPEGIAAAAPPYLGQRPTLGGPRPLEAPKVARHTVGGLDVLLVQRRGAALLEARVVLPVGAGSAPPAQAGLPQALASLITEGAGGRSAAQLAEALEGLGATLKATVSAESTTLALSVLRERYGEAAPLLADVLLRPNLAEADWQRVRAERLAEVARARGEPRQVADRALVAALYGEQHPYGLSLLGTEETLKKLDLGALRALHQARYVARGAHLVLVGDVQLDRAEAERLAGALRGWPAGERGGAEGAAAPPRPAQARLVLVDRPGAPQTELRVATLAQAQGHADRVPAEVANLILGGSFTSRLNQNLREKHGYTYGAASRLQRLGRSGHFVAQLAVRTDVTRESLQEVQKELRQLLAEPVPAAELDKGRRSLLQRLVVLCERPAGLAQFYGELVRYGQPLGELAYVGQRARAVTAQELLRSAQPFMDPAKMTVIVVGDLQKVEPTLQPLDLGPRERRDADGLPVSR